MLKKTKQYSQNKFHSISTKLVLLLSFSASLALILSFIAIFIYTFYENKTNRFELLFATTKVIGENLLAAVDFDDDVSAKKTLHTLSFINGVEGAFVFKDKNIFASYLASKQDADLLLFQVQEIYKEHDKKKKIEYINYNYIILNYPIFIGKEYIASVCVISSTNQLKESLVGEGILLLIVFIITLTIIAILSLKMQKTFTTPIFQMKEAIEDISLNKNYNVNIHAKDDDEFRVLFEGFNYMIATIKESTEELEKAKQEIAEVNKQTKASIEYAALIQSSLIPNFYLFRKYFKDYFTIWHPKDLVGGDIYLFEELRSDDECLLMVIDCTGHGVPGAFVTMLVKAIERQIVERIKHSDEIVSPAKILSIFNSSMKHLLKQDNEASISNAGFDGQIIYYNKKKNILKCASARNDIYYYKNDKLHTIKGDRQSIGYKDSQINYIFTEHVIDTSDGLTLYALTDGFVDQNGGEKELPYGKRRLKEMLEDIHNESMADQQEEFLYTYEMYKNRYDVTDDLTIIGFKI